MSDIKDTTIIGAIYKMMPVSENPFEQNNHTYIIVKDIACNSKNETWIQYKFAHRSLMFPDQFTEGFLNSECPESIFRINYKFHKHFHEYNNDTNNNTKEVNNPKTTIEQLEL